MRFLHVAKEHLVDHGARFRRYDIAVIKLVRFKMFTGMGGAEDAAGDVEGPGAAEADDTDASISQRRGQGGYGVT